MKGPHFLPDRLVDYTRYAHDRELFDALISSTEDLISFFKSACEDNKWFKDHSLFIRLVLRWVSKQFFLEQLSLDDTKPLAKIIQDHFSILQKFLFFRSALFFTMTLFIEKQSILVNSLLFGAGSSVLRRIFKQECFENLDDQLVLTRVKRGVFRKIEQFLYTGALPGLVDDDYENIVDLMHQAKLWEISDLVSECTSVLCRYLNSENVVDTILRAHQKEFIEWKENALVYFNQLHAGLHFILGKPSELKIEFTDFNPETLHIFYQFANWVTHLIFPEQLSAGPEYEKIFSFCPKIVGVDLSGSHTYLNQFAPLPHHLRELALCNCFWLMPEHLRILHEHCPALSKLELADNGHLKSLVWQALNQFKKLHALNLARCYQLENHDIRAIALGCRSLTELDIEGCRKLDNKGLIDLIESCSTLQEFNLSYFDNLSDQVLAEIAVRLTQLSHLKLIKCTHLTDKGLLQLVRLRPSLKYLNVEKCHFSTQALELIQKNYSWLELRY